MWLMIKYFNLIIIHIWLFEWIMFDIKATIEMHTFKVLMPNQYNHCFEFAQHLGGIYVDNSNPVM